MQAKKNQKTAASDELLRVENLKKHFPVLGGVLSRPVAWVRAVDGISFQVKRGETLGIVGESGCGKSTAGRLILHLIKPTEGKVYFEGHDVFSLNSRKMLSLRQNMTMVFQDPYSSLDTRMSVARIIEEPLKIHGMVKSKSQGRERVAQVLNRVGLRPEHMKRYPHEFSGGQRQRIAIARTLVLNPKLIIADEPVSALDVSIQAQVLNLMKELQSDFGLTYIFIAHDLRVVQYISDRVAVMYLGRLVEVARVQDIYSNPQHPYTQALMAAAPIPNPRQKKNATPLEGDVPSPLDPPPGCHFHQRCSYAKGICRQSAPELTAQGNQHQVACHFPLTYISGESK